MLQMILDEGRDEVVAVVVAIVHAQFERQAAGSAGLDEKLGLQLLLEVDVRFALIDEYRAA